MFTIIIPIITVLCIVIGLFGVIIPLLPGVPIAWFGIFIYAYATGFAKISMLTVLVFLVFTLLTMILDLVAPMIGAKRYHATKYGVLGSSLGLILGIFTLGPVGIFLGPFLGAFLGEIFAGRKSNKALHAALGAFIGLMLGSLIKIIFIFIMAGFFIVSLF